MKSYRFAIVGATGLVGRTFLKVLEEEKINVREIRLFASPKSKGKKLLFHGKEVEVDTLQKGCFQGCDFALFSAGASVSKEWAPVAAKEGAIVVDNSSQWRMDPDCALIVPEINIEDYKNASRIIANPNCSTIQSVLPLKPLEDAFSLTRVTYTTFQAVSGSGEKGIDDYHRCLEGKEPQFYPYNIAKTCIPEIDIPMEEGYTKEEIKMVKETRKILHHPSLKVSATCVRVPVEVGHGVSIQAEFLKPFTLEKVKALLSSFEGVKVVDDLPHHIYPVSTLALDNNSVYVGRIRKDLARENSLLFYCVANNVRKGAAANAVQIVEKIIHEEETHNV